MLFRSPEQKKIPVSKKDGNKEVVLSDKQGNMGYITESNDGTYTLSIESKYLSGDYRTDTIILFSDAYEYTGGENIGDADLKIVKPAIYKKVGGDRYVLVERGTLGYEGQKEIAKPKPKKTEPVEKPKAKETTTRVLPDNPDDWAMEVYRSFTPEEKRDLLKTMEANAKLAESTGTELSENFKEKLKEIRYIVRQDERHGRGVSETEEPQKKKPTKKKAATKVLQIGRASCRERV